MEKTRCIFMEGGPWPFDKSFQTEEPEALKTQLRLASLFFDEVRIAAGDFTQSTTLYKAMCADPSLWDADRQAVALTVGKSRTDPELYPRTYEEYVRETAFPQEDVPGLEYLLLGRPSDRAMCWAKLEMDQKLRQTSRLNLRIELNGPGVTPLAYCQKAMEIAEQMKLQSSPESSVNLHLQVSSC